MNWVVLGPMVNQGDSGYCLVEEVGSATLKELTRIWLDVQSTTAFRPIRGDFFTLFLLANCLTGVDLVGLRLRGGFGDWTCLANRRGERRGEVR